MFVGKSNVSVETAGNTFCNPINIDYRFSITPPSMREAADPCIITFNNEYYLFASHSGGYWWSTNMKDWNLVVPTGLDIEKFAPAVIAIGNTMYYTSSEGGAIYKTTDPKGGKWTYVNKPLTWHDPALFVDDDGRVYCYYGCSTNGFISAVELDPNNNFNVIGNEVKCFYSNPKAHGFEVPGDNNTDYNADTWIEGAWMTKYNGTYYLQYAVPGTQFRSYCNGVYKASSPKGPFVFCESNPVVAKPLGFVTGTGHGCTFQDLNGKYWNVETVAVAVKHWFERRLAIFPLEFDEDGVMHCNTTLGDYPQFLPGGAKIPAENNLAGWYLLSKGKSAVASSTFKSFFASNAFDENIKTVWSAATGNIGEWLQVDLEKDCTLNAIQANFSEQDTTYTKGRAEHFSYKYKIEYSADGTNWSILVDKSKNDKDYPHDYTELNTPVKARYIKVTNMGNVPGNGKFAISDLRLFGNGGSALPGAVISVKASRNADQRSATVSWDNASGAQGYIIRYGISPTKLYNNYQILSGNSYTINSLNLDQDYYFAVDAYNDSGITKGTVIASAPHFKDKTSQSKD